jgi:peptidyl-prolyl cis-trans isomerase A (cyclophilin A)
VWNTLRISLSKCWNTRGTIPFCRTATDPQSRTSGFEPTVALSPADPPGQSRCKLWYSRPLFLAWVSLAVQITKFWIFLMKKLIALRHLLLPGMFVWLFSSAPVQAQTSHVCMDTSLGKFCIELYADVAPATVANFLNYVNGGDYDGTFFHRNARGFVLQGGGYYYSNTLDQAVAIPVDPPVVNEFNRSNLRGTIAMAKLGDNPNSATNEWFINLGDNNANLDAQNGGFTVFGKVVGNGMVVVDAIAGRSNLDLSSFLGGAFTDVPILKVDTNLSKDDFITLKSVSVADPNNLPPSVVPTAVGIFNGISLTMPVQYRGVLYRMIFDIASTPPLYKFRLRSSQIIQLIDVGQARAVYRHGVLVLPSVLYGSTILNNLVFRLTDTPNLEFTLISFQR